MKIEDLPIPDSIKEQLKEEGITSLYPPQEEAVKKGLFDDTNLVIAIPTASGKTLLALFACIKKLTETGLKTLYLSPLRALAFEKYMEFKSYLDPLNKRTILLTGDYDEEDTRAKYADVIIATNEKIDSAIRHQARWLNKIGLIVTDEVHLINDSSRGPTLEVVIAQLRQVCDAQILALSATIRNADQIARWLEAELVSSNWRPVKLNEGVLFDKTIVYGDGSEVTIPSKVKDSFNNLADYILSKKNQALVFVTTRNMAESTARNLSTRIARTLSSEEREKLNAASSEILNTGEQTKQSRGLAQLVRSGVSYHHAGLNTAQRRIIEHNFKQGYIKFISATPTLCMSENTQIWSDMEEIHISDFITHKKVNVLHENNIIQIKALEVNANSNVEYLVQISSVCGYSIKLTPNHKILVKRGNQKMVVSAGELKKTDKIATPRKLNLLQPHNIQIRSIVKDNIPECHDTFIDEKISYFLGLMLGDGYSGAELKVDEVIFKGTAAFVNKDEELLSAVYDVCNTLNLSCNKNINAYGTTQIALSKKLWFREFLARSGVVKGSDKHISKKLMEMNRENIANLLRGLFDSDGYVNTSRNVGFSNISIQLVKQVQKLLLRFGIVSRIRERKPGKISLRSREYATKKSYELIIGNKNCLRDFYEYIGFGLPRKRKSLEKIINRINDNFLYVSCSYCNYKIYKNLFTGRTQNSRNWGDQKFQIIKLLGEQGELGSREIKKQLGFEPKKNVSRLNHHYELILKRKIGSINPSEWFWSLNSIGEWIYANLIKREDGFNNFFQNKSCPLCKRELRNTIYLGWKESDFDGDIYWDIIREIKTVSSEPKVYDLILPNAPKNDHLFVANGFFIHNSAGVNLPARYVIIKSIYRYDVTLGSYPIPVLEFKQQSGRAGRPQYDKEGDAIVIAKNEFDATSLYQTYITGEAEDIESRIAAEPALRKIVLGQISTENTQTMEELHEFFGQTFYGFQQDSANLSSILNKVVKFLQEEALIVNDPDYLIPTSFGKRVSQLYIDPLSAIVIREGLIRGNVKSKHYLTDLSFLQLVCSTPDVRFLTIKKDEQINLINFISEHEEEFLTNLPETSFDLELFMSQLKTSLVLQDWIKELPEDIILDRYKIGSGDVYMVVSNAEWLLYASSELSQLLGYKDMAAQISAVHNRVVNGIKQELLDLVQIPGIGRVRARALYDKGLKSQEILKETNPNEIMKISGFGKELVKNIYTHLLGDGFSETSLGEDSKQKDEIEEDNNSTPPQKMLDDFFS